MTQSATAAAPRVSVLMPVFNGARYLAPAIESILGQTYADFEFLILDDGSTDATPGIIARYAAADPRIRTARQENQGVSKAANTLLAMARGEYLARMDADDVSLPHRIERQVACLDAHPEIAILGGRALYTDAFGRPIFVPKPALDHEGIDAANLVGQSSIVHPTAMMRADFVRRIGGYEPSCTNAEDLDLWLRAAEHGRLANLEEVVLHYRFNENGVSGVDVAAQSKMAAEVCRAAWARRGLPPQRMVDNHWRPTRDRASQRDFALKWGWQAWKAGNRGTARHFFLRALRFDPLSLQVWRSVAVGYLR